MSEIFLDIKMVDACANVFRDLVRENNERSVVIVALAHLDALTEDVIGTMLPGLDFGFKKNVDVLTAHGLIAPAARDVLMAMDKIRQNFAHLPSKVALTDPQLRGHLGMLHKLDPLITPHLEKLEELGIPKTEALFFAGAAMVLSDNLLLAKHFCPRPQQPPIIAEVSLRLKQ